MFVAEWQTKSSRGSVIITTLCKPLHGIVSKTLKLTRFNNNIGTPHVSREFSIQFQSILSYMNNLKQFLNKIVQKIVSNLLHVHRLCHFFLSF